MSDLKIIMMATDSLTPDPNNARTHSPEQIKSLCKLIERFGFNNPIAIRPNKVIGAGNGRWLAATQLKIPKVPTITLNLSDEEWEAWAIADNRIALDAGWNQTVLRATLARVASLGNVTDLTAFRPRELSKLGVGSMTDRTAPQLSSDLVHRVIVDCRDEQHQGELIERLQKEGETCRPLIS